MPHHAAADLAALIHRITDAVQPSPLDIIELRRAFAAGFAAQHPIEILQAAHDRGMTAAEFQGRFAYARAVAARPLPAPGEAGAGGGRLRERLSEPRERRAHISEIPSGVSRALGIAQE